MSSGEHDREPGILKPKLEYTTTDSSSTKRDICHNLIVPIHDHISGSVHMQSASSAHSSVDAGYFER